MGKITPPSIIRAAVESDVAVISINQLINKLDDIVFNPPKAAPKTCECCGAPLQGNKCDYCGVEYK